MAPDSGRLAPHGGIHLAIDAKLLHDRLKLPDFHMGGCQNYGPFLDPYYF